MGSAKALGTLLSLTLMILDRPERNEASRDTKDGGEDQGWSMPLKIHDTSTSAS